MDTSGQAEVVISGPIISKQSQEDDTGNTTQPANHTAMVGSSAHTLSSNNGLDFQVKFNADSTSENRSQILKSHSDSEESNESGSLPSKSSSTIDSSGSLEKQDGAAAKSSKRIKTNKRKKDRSKLRKGKWTVSSCTNRLSLKYSSHCSPYNIIGSSWKKRSTPLELFIISALVF